MGDAGSAHKTGNAAAPARPAWPLPRRVWSTHSTQEWAWSPCSNRSSSWSVTSRSHGVPVYHGSAFLTHLFRLSVVAFTPSPGCERPLLGWWQSGEGAVCGGFHLPNRLPRDAL